MAKKIILFIIIGIIVGLGVGLVATRQLFSKYPKLFCTTSCQTAVTEDRTFFSDRVLLVGKTEDNKNFFLDLDLNRKKIGNTFSHYYYGTYSVGGKHRNVYTSFVNDSSAAVPHEFLTAFKTTMADDLSTRENYAIGFTLGDISITAQLPNLAGDFIVKNTPEYTKYSNEGEAQVTVNNASITAHVYTEKIYSSDYSKYVFFNGYDDLESLTQMLVLWDQEGNFYFLDTSSMEARLEDYRPHTWALYKNKKGGYTRKSFSANVQAHVERDKPQSWDVGIADFNAIITLTPVEYFSNEYDDGLVQGNVTTSTDTLPLFGYFYYHHYK